MTVINKQEVMNLRSARNKKVVELGGEKRMEMMQIQ